MRIGGAPLGLVTVEVASDLRRAGAERTDELGQFDDLTGARIEGEPVRGQRLSEPRIGHHRGVPDAVDGVDRVPHADRVQPSPPSLGEHPGVDLQVQMTVRIARPRGVMPHGYGVNLGDRHLDLTAARTDAGGRVLRQPADDLLRGRVLRRVVCG